MLIVIEGVVAALLFICVTASAQRNLAPITDRCQPGGNVGMDTGELSDD